MPLIPMVGASRPRHSNPSFFQTAFTICAGCVEQRGARSPQQSRGRLKT
ncbi:hypothetical protein [Kingella potus]|nr:hypothetical protein [Kingella potus]UOP01034.1 hypothetical protein LVJ84_01245 [Kingella potus]